jgi:hypothetical protein
LNTLALLPLDARPVCLDLPKRLAATCGLTLLTPAPELLGQLKAPAAWPTLKHWLEQTLPTADAALISLDMLAFGGLIPSRCELLPVELWQHRLELLKLLKGKPVKGFGSILRIPAYNSAEEEPAFYEQYGTTLAAYSQQVHAQNPEAAIEALLQPHETLAASLKLPLSVLTPWLHLRLQHFQLNAWVLEALKKGDLSYLCLGQDDTHGLHGLNLLEAAHFKTAFLQEELKGKGHVQTGADELAQTLLVQLLLENSRQEERPKLWVACSHSEGLQADMRFDGEALHALMKQRFQALGLELAETPNEADLWLLCHTPASAKGQGDHCEEKPAHIETSQTDWMQTQLKEAQSLGKGVILADLAYTNGADPEMINTLLANVPQCVANLYGYAGWNTPGNALGSALAMGVVRWWAQCNNRFDALAFRQLLLLRLADDWLYQSQVRRQFRQATSYSFGAPEQLTPADEDALNTLMSEGLMQLKTLLQLSQQEVYCRFPCRRSFEIELELLP